MFVVVAEIKKKYSVVREYAYILFPFLLYNFLLVDNLISDYHMNQFILFRAYKQVDPRAGPSNTTINVVYI